MAVRKLPTTQEQAREYARKETLGCIISTIAIVVFIALMLYVVYILLE